MDKDIKVLLVEDHTMTRMGLALVLEKAEGITLIGEADNGAKGVELAKSMEPDVILMDIGLPVVDGIEATKQIKALKLFSKILIFTSRDNEDDVFASLKAGADGYIMKGATASQLQSAIIAINDGTAWLDPAIAKLVLSNIQRTTKTFNSGNTTNSLKNNSYGLTEREIEVLSYIVNGLTNPQIAEQLFITRATAKAHVHSILQKLYAENRTQATIMAIKEGLV